MSKSFIRSSGIVSAMTLVSRILGLIRDFVIARLFGANHADWQERNTHKKCWIENEFKARKKRPMPSEQPKRTVSIQI